MLYLRRNTSPKGRLTYEYDLKTHERRYSNGSVPVLRKLATVWSMFALGRYLSSPRFMVTAKRCMDNILDSYLVDNRYLVIQQQAWLGHQAFMLAALLTLDEPDYRSGMIDDLIETSLSLENKDGGFVSVRILPDHDDGTISKQVYYSGEGLTALAMAATYKNDPELLGMHRRVMPFYERMFDRIDQWMNMCAWHSKAYAEAFRLSGDEEFARYVKKMNDRLVQRQRTSLDDDVDYVGAFGSSGNSYASGVFLESLVEGLSVAKLTGDDERVRTYSRGLYLGMRYLLSCQIDRRRIFDADTGGRALGGFETNMRDPTVRIDNLQHCSCAIMRFLRESGIGYSAAYRS
jgi:hypothetical protein